MEKTATVASSNNRHRSQRSHRKEYYDEEETMRSSEQHSRSYNDRSYANDSDREWVGEVKTKRSTSTISEDSPGSIHLDDDEQEIIERVPKIKLNNGQEDYISSEEETFREKRTARKSVELNAKLREEIKSGRLGMSDKEELLKKTRLSFQADMSTDLVKSDTSARSLSPNSRDNRFHDDLYFTEDKRTSSPTTWLGKSKSDEKVNRK